MIQGGQTPGEIPKEAPVEPDPGGKVDRMGDLSLEHDPGGKVDRMGDLSHEHSS